MTLVICDSKLQAIYDYTTKCNYLGTIQKLMASDHPCVNPAKLTSVKFTGLLA